MGIKLIHHDKESLRRGTSPFDEAIIELVKNKDICIICPYIGRDYFDRIIKSANSWHLVTDVEALMRSHNQNARHDIENLIKKHLSNIHHYKDIHAKVIITDNSAFIGSANFTEKGITKRVEMSVLIEEKEQVDRVQKWFWDLWNETQSVNSSDLEKYASSIMSLPSPDFAKPEYSLPSNAPAINAKLADIGSTNIRIEKIIKNNQESHNRLINSNIGLIMPLEYDSQNYDTDRVVFEAKDYFFRNKIREARWLEFERKNKIEFSEMIRNYWKKAVLVELERSKKSGFRNFHEPVVYEAVMNLSYRNNLLDETFS